MGKEWRENTAAVVCERRDVMSDDKGIEKREASGEQEPLEKPIDALGMGTTKHVTAI